MTSWTGSAQGPYPVGNASAQPNLGFAFPNPAAGARDQTFRLIVHPGLWGRSTRLRFSNAYGTQPVTFDHVFAGEQAIAGTLVKETNTPVSFGGQASVTVQPGQSVWSDPVSLPFVHDPADPALTGRKLAISLHVAGQSGPMTWHAKALATSYVTAPGSGDAAAADEGTTHSHSPPRPGTSSTRWTWTRRRARGLRSRSETRSPTGPPPR